MAEEKTTEAVGGTEPVGSGANPVGATDAGVAEASSWKFDWTADDGETRSFTKPAELADFLRQSAMRKKDYETAMARVSSLEKSTQDQRSRYEALERQLAESPGLRYDKWLREDPRRLQAALAQMSQLGPRDPKDVVRELLDEQLKPLNEKLAKYESAEEQRANRERREAAFGRLPEGTDRKAIEQIWARLEETPPQDLEYTLLSIIADAVRARSSPPAPRERRPSVTSSPGSKDAEDDVAAWSDTKVRQQAEADLSKMLGR